jgi:hypothetical protein
VPYNGEISDTFGVYESVCCGAEIVIAEGGKFPDCPKHPKLLVEWNPTTDEPIRHVHELRRNNKDAA